MQGYAFLDLDCKLQYRSKEYIEVDNPYFWQQNKEYILRAWKFDSDDLSTMKLMFSQLREIFRQSKVSQEPVAEFCRIIGFDPAVLRNS